MYFIFYFISVKLTGSDRGQFHQTWWQNTTQFQTSTQLKFVIFDSKTNVMQIKTAKAASGAEFHSIEWHLLIEIWQKSCSFTNVT